MRRLGVCVCVCVCVCVETQPLEFGPHSASIRRLGGWTPAFTKSGDTNSKSAAALGIVNGILSLGTAVAGAFTAQAQGEASIAASEAAVTMQQQQLDAEAEARETNKVAGIPLNAFLAIAGAVTAIIVIALLTRR